MHAIETVNLSKTFKGKNHAAVKAVRDLTLSVESGEVFGFLGPNGAGKSTTIKMLMGLIKPTVGHARIMGDDTGSPLSRKHVGYLPENPAYYDYLTAEEYLAFIGRAFSMSDSSIGERTESLLKLLDLHEARKRPLRGFSKGMVQRLGLAQALIHDPDVYVLDEPMSGLDPVGRALVKDIILDLKAKGKCVFFSTHITADVETVCDRVGIIVQGTLQHVEQVDSILTTGITGYRLRVRTPGSQEQEDVEVAKSDFQKCTTEIHAAGREITLIEPKRKNVEAFFLDIVKGKQC